MFVQSGQIWYDDVIRRGLMQWHFSWSGEFWCNDMVRLEEIWCDNICVIRRDLFLCHLWDQERSYRMAFMWSEETWYDWMIRADLIWWCDQKRFVVTTFICVIRRDLSGWHACDQKKPDVVVWSGQIWYDDVIRIGLMWWHLSDQERSVVMSFAQGRYYRMTFMWSEET